MVLDQRTKRYLKVFLLVFALVVLVGCKSNLDSDGNLIASRAITGSTKWTIDAGIFDFLLVIPIAKGILFIESVTGNVIWGVIGMTILINIIILPVMIKSSVSTQKMQLVQPEIERIQNKYKGKNDQASQMRMSQEIQNLYKKYDINMFSSFIMFVTFPIMIAMWQAVQRVQILYSSSFLGLDLGATPMSMIGKGHYQYVILIVIMALTQFGAMQINQIMSKRSQKVYPNEKNPMDQMKTMNYMMTAMIVYFGLVMPSAMSFYWITTNIITVLRTVYIQIHYIEKELDANKKNVVR